MSTPIRIKRSAVPGKVPTTSDLQLGELAINTFDGKAYLKKDVSGSETIVNVGGGYPGNTYYVSETGLDTNDGQNISSAFLTIKTALAVATAGDTIEISSGTFTEIFPLTVPAGVIVRGKGLRSTIIQPTAGTERLDCFLMNGETTVEELTVTNFYYNSSTDTGYAFRFAPNMVTTTRSPYVQRVSVITRGSTITATDPYGFATVDNYPTTKVAGRGAFVDGSVVSSATLEPAMLFNEATFITPNQTGLKMTNGARAEWVNCFTYFSSVSIDGSSGSVGVGSSANATLKLSGVTTSIAANYVIKYYQGGPAVAIGTVVSVDGAYVTISGKGSGIFNAVGIGSTQDVRIFQSNGTTQVGTASTILWADYQKFGADLRAIGSASNFGTVGVRGDGAGVQLRLFGYNFGCVGSGKTFTQDPTLTIRSNEAVQLNGGRVFFQSVDQAGNFRVGNIFEISQETGAVSLASTSDINIAGTATIQNLNVTGVSTFQNSILHQNSNFNTDQTTYNLINSAAGAVNFAGAGTSIVIGATTGITTIRNYKVNLSGGQDSFTTTDGTLVVVGGVGISSNLNVGKDFKVTGVSTFVAPVRLDSSLRVAGVSTFVSDVELNNNVRVTGVSTFSAPAMINSNLNVTGITTTGNFRVTGISTLSGDVQLSNNLQVTGISTFSNTINHNSALFITNQSTYRFIDTTTTTVTAFGDATSIGIGSTNATLTLRPSTVVGTNATQTLYNTVATTVNAFGAATAINVGANTGTLTIGNPVVVGTQASQNLYDNTATTISAFGSATTISVGATSATLTLRPATVVGVNATQTLYNTVATTVNAFGQATSVGIGSTTATLTLRPATVVGTNATQNLYNTVATTVNAFGAATAVNIGAATGTLTVGNATATFTNATTVNVNGANPTIAGSSTGTLTLFNTNLTKVDAFQAATDIVLAATTGVTTVRNNLSATGTITAGNFTTAGIATFSGTANNINQTAGTAALNRLTVAGVSTFTGQLNYGTASGTTLNNTGTATFNNVSVTGVLTAPTVISSTAGSFAQLNVTGIATVANFTISSGIITGPSAIVIDPAGVGDNTGSVRIKGDLYVDGTQTTVNSTVVEVGDKLVGLGTTAIEIVVLKTNVNISAGQSVITGISTNFLSIGYGVSSNSSTGAGSSIVSIGSSSVGIGTSVAGNTDVTLPNVVIGIATTRVSVASTLGIIVGAALSAAAFNANTVVTSVGLGTIFFSPASINVGVSTLNVTFTNNGVFYFTDLLTGDVVSDGGGILLYGKTNKTFTWSDTTDSWTSSENLDLVSGKVYKINGTEILTATNLGISNVNALTGVVTTIQGTSATYTNTNATTVTTVNLTATGSGTISTFTATNANVTGIATIATLNASNSTLGLVGITTLRALAGVVTDIAGTNLNYNGIGTIQTLNVPTAATFKVINDANISGITSVNSFIGTDFYVTGVGTFGNVVNINSGISTRFQTTDLNVVSGVLQTVGIATTTGTFVGLNTNIVGVTTAGLLIGDSVSGTYIFGGSTIASIGNTSITLSFSSSSPVGTSTTSLTFTRSFTPAGVGTIPNFRSTNVAISGIASINSGIVTNLIVGLSSISTLNVNVGFATEFAILSGVTTGLHILGVGTATTLYVNSGITTRSSITDLTVTGVGSFATIANVYTPLGLSTIGHLTGTNINYSGIATANILIAGLTTITTLNVTGVSSLPNLYGSDIQYTGISTLTQLRGTNLYYSGLSTAVNFNSTDTIVSGAASISTLRANVGIITNSTWTNGYSAGITSVATLNVNSGVVTTITVTNATAGYLIGTNVYYSGIGSISNFNTNIGVATFLSGTNLNYSGVGTITYLNNINLNVSGVTTISTLLISPNNELTYLNNGTNLAFSGIGTIDTLRSNIGFVTTLSGTNLNYSGVGTISSIQNINITNTGIGTFNDLISNSLNVTGIGTVGTLNITTATFTRLNSVDQIISGVSSISTLRANVGIITHLSGTNLSYSGVGTIATIQNVNLNTTGVGTIVTLNGTNSLFTGISTFGTVRATSIITDALDLSGQAINFTGIATFNTLFSTNGTISYLRGTSTNFTGINTLGTIYNVDINSTGFTTTRGLHVGVGGTILTATNVSGIGSVGINTTSAKHALQVWGEFGINGNTVVGTISTTRNNNSAVKVHTSLGRAEFRTVEYTVQASIGNTHQVTKILSIHDGVTAYNSEYSNVSTGVDVATYDVQIDNSVPPGFIALVVTPVSNVGVTTIVVNYTATRI